MLYDKNNKIIKIVDILYPLPLNHQLIPWFIRIRYLIVYVIKMRMYHYVKKCM